MPPPRWTSCARVLTPRTKRTPGSYRRTENCVRRHARAAATPVAWYPRALKRKHSLRSPTVGMLEGQRAVVTGGASGVGRAACRRFAEEGAAVAVLDLDGEAAAAVASEFGGASFAVDVRDADGIRAAVDDAAARMGGLDTVFNNAGVGSMA